jgi:hypothetical protein
MNRITTLLMLAGLTFSSTTFAGGQYITHESTYEPAYLNRLSNSDALGGRIAGGTVVIAHESTYDPAHLRSLDQAPAARGSSGVVINHESLFDPMHLRRIKPGFMSPTRSAAAPADTSAI